MSKQNRPVPESVILEIQAVAHERKQRMLSQQVVVQEAQKRADQLRHQLVLQEHYLGGLADFLQEHAADSLASNETWRSRLGLTMKPDET